MTGLAKGTTTVAVAMSGGVDSSVAAALLKEKGRDVFGLTMSLYALPRGACASEHLRSCCGWKAKEDASRVAVALGIPHYVVDLRKEFERDVVADFCAEYGRGRTPNPCIRCNRFVKFGPLFKRAERLGARRIATGHYARVARDEASGRWLLRKGMDPAKDQSYFLYPLRQEDLSRVEFPVGEYSKKDIRQLAKIHRLPVAEKPESQEICFVPDNDYAGFLRKRCPEIFRPGPILDVDGRTIGQHRGVGFFTIGQRKGMGIAAPRPLYVVAIDAARNTIIAGSNDDLYQTRLEAADLHWISWEGLSAPRRVRARIRYKHVEADAVVAPLEGGRVAVEFEKPQRAITPGQAVVFYEDDVVAGGGTIDRVGRE
jgi:tRNA-specific 2-thiouridylase